MRIAFKEWAIVVDALGVGEQIIILRKGGLHEGRTGFAIEHQNFLLFPTQFHQQRESVVQRSQMRFDQIQPDLDTSSRVRLEFCAEVIDGSLLESIEAAERLRGQHIWRDEVIRKRFDWGTSRSIYALAVRVCRLRSPLSLQMTPSYGGCKSWIELDEEIDAADSVPVLADEAFTQRLRDFRSALCVTT